MERSTQRTQKGVLILLPLVMGAAAWVQMIGFGQGPVGLFHRAFVSWQVECGNTCTAEYTAISPLFFALVGVGLAVWLYLLSQTPGTGRLRKWFLWAIWIPMALALPLILTASSRSGAFCTLVGCLD